MNDTTELLSMLRLKFNIEHPTVEESYSYGFEAAKAGFDEVANPYSEATSENRHWADGWWAGFYGEEPLFVIGKEEVAKEIPVANEHTFTDNVGSLFVKMLEITSVIGVAALVGYQVLELVA